MPISLTAKDFVDFIRLAARKIGESGDYITALDAATGDGDHWVNINMGLTALCEAAPELESLAPSECFKKIGGIMMSRVGGSSGILYGGAYMACAKLTAGLESIDAAMLAKMLETMAQDMCRRGKSEPGQKTMIDALAPAAAAFSSALSSGACEREAVEAMRRAANDGAQSTLQMPAVKGRASYQADKGVGHLDPGAVSMAMQIDCLCDCVLGKIGE